MILIENFSEVMAQIEKERGIDRKVLIDAISAALIAASKKKFGNVENLEVTVDETTGEALIFASKEVVTDVVDPMTQIKLEAAKQYQEDVAIGDVIMIEVTPDDFGRIAAQTAKQVILQRIREAEKDSIYSEFGLKVGSIVTGTVQRKEGRNYLINLGRTEAVLPGKDQIPGEHYNQGDPIKVYVVSVDKSTKGPKIVISRTHVGLLKALFELEVPEVHEGIIEVKSVAREVGIRAKVSVKSNDSEVGAVGTCVGHMGGRIQNIVKELNNEKIDIIEWSEDPYELLVNALRPAKINKIKLEEKEGEKIALVFVNEDQLSLAIGKNGLNVRLASKLTGWKIDIQTEQSSFAANLRSAIEAEKKEGAQPEQAAGVPEASVTNEKKQEEIKEEVNTEEKKS